MYHQYIPLFRPFSPGLALAREIVNRFLGCGNSIASHFPGHFEMGLANLRTFPLIMETRLMTRLFPHRVLIPMLVLSTCCHSAFARTVSVEQVLRDFSRCDDSFFTPANMAALNPGATLAVRTVKGRAWLDWGEMRNKEAEITLPKRLEVAGLPLRSLISRGKDIGNLGAYYSWEFVLEADRQAAESKLLPLFEAAAPLSRLKQDVYARSESLGQDGQWRQDGPAPTGLMGKQQTWREFQVSVDQMLDLTTIKCSLMGNVTPALLMQHRPDIPATQYPVAVPPLRFERSAVPVSSLQTLDAAVARNSVWRPKFSRLRYVVTGGGAPQIVTMTREGQLIDSTTLYDESLGLSERRLSWANLIPLKSMFDYGMPDNAVSIAETLSVELPRDLSPGSVLTYRSRLQEQAVQKGGEEDVRRQCKSSGVLAAHRIHPSLNGEAVLMNCETGDAQEQQAYIMELGIFLPLMHRSQKTGQTEYRYSDLNVEK
ncbi:hypothetical protein [Chromobacterium sp. LK1]|uniref:hypothetical protein n=1 Tax=Chromobacterium sp. LK1 TaxID=1628193 RepID=UPI0012E17CCB|nr:hypothetical protein [Chromobacterium sp. LK1]